VHERRREERRLDEGDVYGNGVGQPRPDRAGDDRHPQHDRHDGRIGVVSGTLKIAAAGGKTEAHFTAVYDHGTIAGTASGHGATPHVQLLGNVSAGFSATGGFTSGKIGGGTAGGSAVELSGPSCGPRTESHGKKATGAITSVTAASVTVAGLTRVVPPTSLRIDIATQYSVGDRVEISCTLVSGTWTLVKIEKKR
jgi:hypothetical protein